VWQLAYVLHDIPWDRINVAQFRIDAAHSNAYMAAGGPRHTTPFPSAGEVRKIRSAQELSLSASIQRDIAGAIFRDTVVLELYATVAYWITPHRADPPAEPVLIETKLENDNVVLRWRPNTEPFFYSYEVYVLASGIAPERISPEPLRAAIYVDTAPAKGTRIYAIRSVTASGVGSAFAYSDPVAI
jgi:hypothetical protein